MEMIFDHLILRFDVDSVGLFFLVLTTVLFALVSVYARSYTEDDAHRDRFFLFLALTYLALCCLAVAGNLFTFFLCK